MEGKEPFALPAQRAATDLGPLLAFNAEEPLDLNFTAQRRKPQVTVAQLMVVRIEEGVVKYDFTFHYNVLYSGIKSLGIDVPNERLPTGCESQRPASTKRPSPPARRVPGATSRGP